MNSTTLDLLQKHFDLALDAPDGIKKLRELILTLAMQGKLVPQNPKDQPASELLKEIEAEKRRLLKEGKIKEKTSRGLARAGAAPMEGAEIKPEDVPYEVPVGWEWTTLSEVSLVNPRNDIADSMHVSFVPMTLISSDYRGSHRQEKRQWSDVKQGFTHFAQGDIGVAKITPCFENSKACIFTDLINGYGAGTTELHIVRPVGNTLNQRYVLFYLKAPQFLDLGNTKMTGTAGQKRLPKDFLERNPFPLPPLAEQKRIVAKIDQLMASCDVLEELHDKRQQMRLDIHSAAIHQILTPTSATPRLRVKNILFSHFSELYTVKENVTELRKAILQLAMMGKLVPQDPKDQPASELLKEIEAEKRRLVKEGKIKRSPRGLARAGAAPTEGAEIRPEDMPYAVPAGWAWVRFFEINSVKSELVLSNGFPNQKQIAPDSIEKGSGKILLHRTVAEFGSIGPNNRFYQGQILYSKIRPSLNKAVIAPYDGLCSADMYPIDTKIDSQFMLKTILSETFLAQVRLAENRIKMPKLNLESLAQFVIPLPPLAEQKRIVAKIDQLMALCDSLEQGIEAATQKQTQVLQSIIAGVA